jgi:dipeptidyl aminopeptidase/acylaminoacyl peptidase
MKPSVRMALRATCASLGAVAVLTATAAQGAVPAVNGPIAFHSDRDGNYEIYSMNPDGTAQTRLTVNPAEDQLPAWSPDNLRIAFRSNRDGNDEIYVMNADGSNQTRLSNNAADDDWPAWSPDGQKIAFTSNRDGQVELYVMNADGSGQTRLTNDVSTECCPSWSPDSERIVFDSDIGGARDIYVINADGSGQTNITNLGLYSTDPDWSPDGTRMSYTGALVRNCCAPPEVWAMNADGSARTQLTHSGTFDADSAWAPAGDKIAFSSTRNGPPEIYSMNADGSDQTRLTANSVHDGFPDWGSGPLLLEPPDTTPPETTITSGPTGEWSPGKTNDSTPTFTFASNEAGSTFECSDDGGAWQPCSSPYTTPHLADGEHSFRVRATDAAGNTDSTPAERTFTIEPHCSLFRAKVTVLGTPRVVCLVEERTP